MIRGWAAEYLHGETVRGHEIKKMLIADKSHGLHYQQLSLVFFELYTSFGIELALIQNFTASQHLLFVPPRLSKPKTKIEHSLCEYLSGWTLPVFLILPQFPTVKAKPTIATAPFQLPFTSFHLHRFTLSRHANACEA